MTDSYDVCVLGLGVIGAATTLELARRGVRVVGLERFGLPHERGSSGGPNRLIRKAYFEHDDYVPLLHRAYEAWETLEAELGATLLHRTGLLYLGPEDGPLLTGVRRARDAYGLRVDELDRDAVSGAHPMFRQAADHHALFEPDAGFVLADAAVLGMIRLAHARGATVRGEVEVRGARWDADGATLDTTGGPVRASRVVIAAGPWTSAALPALGLAAPCPLEVTRQSVGFVAPAGDACDLGRMPCFAIEERGEPGIWYGFPRLPGAPAMKCARHVPGPVVDPDDVPRDTTAADRAELDAVFRHLPAAAGPITAMRTCLYTMSPDGHFVIGRHPDEPRVTVACGFSGHGFKFGPVMGEVLADLALDGSTAHPVGFLDRRRFAGRAG